MGTPGDKTRISKVVSESTTYSILETNQDQPQQTSPQENIDQLTFPQPGPSNTDMTVLSRLSHYIDYSLTQLPVKSETSGILEQAHIEDFYSQRKYYQQNISDTYKEASVLYPVEPEETFRNLPGPSGLQTPKGKPVTVVSKLNPKRTKKSQTQQTAKKSHACQFCHKSFQNPANLTRHQQIHAGSSPFKCEHCKKSFTSKFKLVRHVLIHSDRKPFSCTVCERTFHRKDHLKNHIKVHSPSKKVYVCEHTDCKKEYTSLLSYKKHSALHSAEAGNLECLICSKKFEKKEDILYHLKIHAGSRTVKSPNEKKFTCDQCDRKFFTRKDVRRHLVVHTGMRDFLCQFCPQRFGRKDHLVRHIKKSHSRNYTMDSQDDQVIKTESDIKFELPETLSVPDIDLYTLPKTDIFLTHTSVQEVLADLDNENLRDVGESSSRNIDEALVGEPVAGMSTNIAERNILKEGVLVNENEIIGFTDPRENLPLPAFSKTFQSPPQQ